MNTSEVRTWALKGAEQRLVEISEEAQAIYRNFPELRARGRSFELDGTGRRQRRKLSAEARKRISEAVRARWARQKAVSAAAKSGESKTASAQPKVRKQRAGARRVGRRPRKLSAAGRKRISEAQKARWAKLRRPKQ